MKLALHSGRGALVLDGGVADVERASGGRFGPDVMALYDEWDAFVDFAAGVSRSTEPLDDSALRPGQVLETWVDGIGTMRNVCR
jgi:2,4-didehydro-3-deoxy-L-rhamnonate hydrolase